MIFRPTSQQWIAAVTIGLLGLTLGAGCNRLWGGDKDFSLRGNYEAPKGGFRIFVVARGAVASGNDLASAARAAVRICPTPASGSPIDFTLTLKRGDTKVWLESGSDTPVLEWNWKTGKALLQSMLIAHGITPVPDELMGSVDVVSSALTGPKGVVLKDQIQSLRVRETAVDYGQGFDLSQPIENWARIQELPLCGAG